MATTATSTWISPIPGVEADQVSTFFDNIVEFGPAKGKKHGGLDLAAPEGTPIYAPMDGKVSRVYSQEAGGNVLVVDHPGGYRTVYAHLDSALVKVGETVKQGQQIARSGSSGVVSGPHLHWEVLRNGTKIDPLDLFDPFVDVPESMYRTSVDRLVDWMNEKLEEDIAARRTWGEWGGGLFNSDFVGSPLKASFGTALQRAVEDLGWGERTIKREDIPTLAKQIIELEPEVSKDLDPLSAIAQTVSAGGDIIGFLVDSDNWARILALVAGGVLALIGFRSMWEASNT